MGYESVKLFHGRLTVNLGTSKNFLTCDTFRYKNLISLESTKETPIK